MRRSISLLFLNIAMLFPLITFAADPVLNFSDITSGPASGFTDGYVSNVGCLVTIWGNNLGSTRGTSKVYFQDSTGTSRETNYYYAWANASVQKGHPADLYTYHKMQFIQFTIPVGSAAGAGYIFVNNGSVSSNGIPFTVRSGNIYFVKTTGSNSNSGTWAAPWLTMQWAVNHINAGDTIYVCDGVTHSGLTLDINRGGTSAQPMSLLAYPGAAVVIDRQGVAQAIYNGYYYQYWNFSRITAKGTDGACPEFPGGRYVAIEVTKSGSYYPTTASGGIFGTIYAVTAANVGGTKYFGNYIHDEGSSASDMSSNCHTFYISNRAPSATPALKIPPEIGWNLLKNNYTNHALHTYDEGYNNGWTGPVKFHDNFVINQKGCGIDISMNTTCTSAVTNEFQYYNNVLVNCGMAGSGSWGIAATFSGTRLQSNIKMYNNVIYGYGSTNSTYPSALGIDTAFGGTVDYRNNIVVDTKGFPYQPAARNAAATYHTNNIWYSTTYSAPSWDTSPITSYPKFVDVANYDFHLASDSPAINTGSNATVSYAGRDLAGIVRPQSANACIGAFEYYTGASGSTNNPPSQVTGVTVKIIYD